jgi:hypothetical protein
MTDTTIRELDVVALMEDLPDLSLLRGQVGTVVLLHDADAFEVEFVDLDGQTYALEVIRRSQLLRLYYEPQQAA